MEAFKPILPSPRYLPDDEVVADKRGNPVLERRSFLLDCQLEEDEVKQRYPKLWAHLEEGKAQGVPKRYLCRHRTPWYTTSRPRSSSAEETRSTSTRPRFFANTYPTRGRSPNDRYRPDSGAVLTVDIPPPSRNQRTPTAGDTLATAAASSLDNPRPIAPQRNDRASWDRGCPVQRPIQSND